MTLNATALHTLQHLSTVNTMAAFKNEIKGQQIQNQQQVLKLYSSSFRERRGGEDKNCWQMAAEAQAISEISLKDKLDKNS